MAPKTERTYSQTIYNITVKKKGSEGESCGSQEENITWKINN